MAGAGGWWIGVRSHRHSSPEAAAERPLYYQSPMHPWIRSDEPGQCTICGMDLAPVYDTGNAPGGATVRNIVMLPGESPRITGIATVPVRRAPLVRTIRVAGRLEVDRRRYSVLAAPVRGRLDTLSVRETGERVERGSPLAGFFSRDLLAAVAEYRAAPASLRSAVALRLRQMGLSPEQIAALPGRAADDLTVPLLAPQGGVVVARHVDQGQWVDEGDPMLEIADLATLWFLFPVYEADLPWVREGAEVTLRTPSAPGETFRASITLIDPGLDETTRTARVRAELANPPGEGGGYRLRHRLFAEGEIAVNAPEALQVPRSAVLRPGGTARVFVETGEAGEGAYRLTPVTLGREGDAAVEVLHGVKEGDRVVTRGAVLLDGQAQLNHPEAPSAPGASASVAGDECPVSGEKLGSMGEPHRFEHEGQPVSLCCKACLADFHADPPAYLRKLP